jgi:CheY-like chemotaxis protein
VDARERVFEPFFTTKAVGVGTGLGLAVSRSIVEQLGGQIVLGDVAPHGTMVTVTLPAHAREPLAPPLPLVGAESESTRKLRVLVVDDEVLVRRALSMVLESHHDVTLAEHGRHALELIGSEPAFDVVLCDLMMPHLNGKDLYEQVEREHAALAKRFVFITGGALGEQMATFLERHADTTLHKPFEIADVLAHVEAAAKRS